MRDSAARNWKDAYRAAIYCTSRGTILAQRISEAEQAIVARSRELFYEKGAEAEVERDALDDAMYALRALKKATEASDAT